MDITITKEDFATLSQVSQIELIKLFTGGAAFLEPLVSNQIDNSENVPADLSAYQVERFMSGVSDSTKNYIKLLVSNGGRMVHEEFKVQSKIKNTAAGFFTPLTKRVRTVLGIKDANLVGWDMGTDQAISRPKCFYLSSQTNQAFEEYFAKKTEDK